MMKANKLQFFLLLVALIFAMSCDRPECINNNPVFDQYTPDSKVYKMELAKQMQMIGPENLRYWFIRSYERGGAEFIEINIQGDGLCAKGELLVIDKSKRKGLRSNGGYRGAELTGVEILTKQDSSGTNFILENIEGIID